MITYATLKTHPSRLLSLTSLTVSEFEALVPTFQSEYAKRISPTHTAMGKPRRRQAGGGNKSRLATPEDRLLFILVYQKTYPVQTLLGELFDLSQSRTNDWIHRLLPILKEALGDLGVLPERDPQQFARHEKQQGGSRNYIIDGTERRRQRPQKPRKTGIALQRQKENPQ